ncbi:MAG: FIST C-terminal domain-containing protein [Candidatus Omnitrophica bacterium]|nr:FIST C-terminal domain-containing protein [Candidatus Omnitrophota bacterium]
MSVHIGIGFSQDLNAEQAAREAAENAQNKLGFGRIDLAMVFSTTHYDPHTALSAIHNTIRCSKLIGCSTAGIILADSIQTRGIAVLAIASEEIKFGIGLAKIFDKTDLYQTGMEFAKNTLKNFGFQGRQVFLSFIDGKIPDHSPFLKGLQEILGNIFPIIGAGSSDDFYFEKTFQFYQDTASNNSAVGLILGGQMGIGVAGRHGWRPLGKPRIITESDQNIIKKIDGEKASFLYEDYFQGEADKLYSSLLSQITILYPLGIYVEGNKEYLLRNPVKVLKDGSIVCQGDIPPGAEIHIMIGNKDSCKQAAREAAQEAQKNLLGKKPKLIIIIESMTRLKLLGRTAFQEIAGVKEIFGDDVPMIGMYSHGEICPFESLEKFRKPLIQNESIVILAIS